jgi:hypothetical protein
LQQNPADKHRLALLGDEAAAAEVVKGLVDRRVLEREIVEVLGERQLGGCNLILDRARLLLRDLGAQEDAAQSSLRRLRTLVCERCGSWLRLRATDSVSS